MMIVSGNNKREKSSNKFHPNAAQTTTSTAQRIVNRTNSAHTRVVHHHPDRAASKPTAMNNYQSTASQLTRGDNSNLFGGGYSKDAVP